MDTQTIQERFMSSSELDVGTYVRLRRLVPLLVVGGVMLPLMAVLFWGDNNWARNAGLILVGFECFLASYLIHRSTRRGQDLPEKSRRLILVLSGVVVLLMIISIFV